MEGTDDSVLVSANRSADNNSAMKKSHFGDHDKVVHYIIHLHQWFVICTAEFKEWKVQLY